MTTRVPDLARLEGHMVQTGPYSFILPDDVPARLRSMPVVDRWEWNGYGDSDFYIAVYDEDRNTFFRVMTWTTRFARPHPCYDPHPDASPELIAEYRDRLGRAIHRRNVRERLRTLRPQLEKLDNARGDLTLESFYRLRHWFRKQNVDIRDNISELIGAKLRSEFRKSLKRQIIAWAQDANPKFKSPLSEKQMQIVLRKYRR